jgi:RNA polymerase sigma-70 factor (ECF subfamily)
MPSDQQFGESKRLKERFEQCVEQCADSMYRVAFRLTGNATLATELVQECYLAAWKNIDSLKDAEKMRGWMFSILRNQYSKLVRSEKKVPQLCEGSMDEIVPASDRDSKSMVTEKVDFVQRALACMDDKFRLPILLVSMEGLSVESAAEALGLPRGTVLSRLHRGREKLKLTLMADPDFLDSQGAKS